MLKLLLPVLLGLVGVGAGVGAKFILAPSSESAPPEAQTHAAADCPPPAAGERPQVIDAAQLVDKEFVKLNNQFVIPIITETRVAALVVMSVTIEVQAGTTELVYSREPKLRDLFLQTMFDQAALGRFSGEFASASNLLPLREELRIVAGRVLGEAASDVLITDIARQDA